MAKEHTVKAFTQELELLKAKVFEMAKECEGQLAKAVHSLVERDTELARDIIEGDAKLIDYSVKWMNSLSVSLPCANQWHWTCEILLQPRKWRQILKGLPIILLILQSM